MRETAAAGALGGACYAPNAPMALRSHAGFVPLPAQAPGGIAGLVLGLAVFLAPASRTQAQSPDRDQDRIDITGRQNLTLGSGARAYGMGGAFLARADDATAASWNPAGLSYLRVPEVSLVGVSNSFETQRGVEFDPNAVDFDRFDGNAIDFAAFTWPVALGEMSGAVQVSYQRAISFDGTRAIHGTTLEQTYGEQGSSDGGFDVVAFGTGLRLSRHVRAGFTVNRWLNGYDQRLTRLYETPNRRPQRVYDLDFRPDGWSFNVGAIVSPVESLNLGVVYKTPFTADVRLEKARQDYWVQDGLLQEVTENAYASEAVRLEFPSSFGFGVSWRPIDTLTLSADFTQTSWSEARIQNYFDLTRTEIGGTPPPPTVYPNFQYPTLKAVPDSDDPEDPARLFGQQDSQQLRVGVEWVLIWGRVKLPLRAGYFNDRQITPNPTGDVPRFNGYTLGTGLLLGPLLVDVAYVHESGAYTSAPDSGDFDLPPDVTLAPVRNVLKTDRVFASLIYRFSGPW
jgi:long-subunit fatty acid transport protein